MANSTIPQKRLQGFRVAILCTDGVEQIELTSPREALLEAGAHVEIVSPQDKFVQGWDHHEPADNFTVDHPLGSVSADDFDALLLPGGVINPDTLRINQEAISFIKQFIEDKKPIAAICHGPWTLIEAGGVRGKKITSWPSLQTDLRNAGAQWKDQSVVRDDLLVSSRKPDDLSDFNREMLEMFSEAKVEFANSKKEHHPSAAPSAQI
jgi:protease I